MENKKKRNIKGKKIIMPKSKIKQENIKKEEEPQKKEEKKDFWGKLGSLVKKAIDCCIE